MDGIIKIVSIARDGTDLRVLVAAHPPAGGDHYSPVEIYAVNSSHPREPVDPEACSHGVAVPEPDDNSGLVHDCEVLLGIRDGLAGRATLNWGPDLSILEWEGVAVGETPPRVLVLDLYNRGITGTIPPDLGQLTELTRISLSSTSDSTPNILTGPIPAELGNLNNLERL